MNRRRKIRFYNIKLSQFFKSIISGGLLVCVLCLPVFWLRAGAVLPPELTEWLRPQMQRFFLDAAPVMNSVTQKEDGDITQKILNGVIYTQLPGMANISIDEAELPVYENEYIQSPPPEFKAETTEKAPPEPREGEKPIEIVTISPSNPAGYVNYGNVFLNNKTKYEIDLEALTGAPLSFSYNQKEMQVLIVHTHGTESYAEEGRTGYLDEDPTRSDDPSQSIIAVGDAIRRELESQGVNVVHDKTIHDKPSFSNSYNNAEETIMKVLKQYPSIKIVLDVHRDGLITEEGVMYRPIVSENGKDYAQVMLVMGSDEGGLSHESWRDNLSFAAKLQNHLNGEIENLARPISLRPQRFNEHATPGSVLFEMGSCGNYLSDALNSAPIVARAVAEVLKQG